MNFFLLFAIDPVQLDLKRVFGASPMIYSLLTIMSMTALVMWLYSLATFRSKDIMPTQFTPRLRPLLLQKNFTQAYALCEKESHILASILKVGLSTRTLGSQVMVDAMKSEGKRLSLSCWQRLSLLNDIAIAAPMVGLLGTVIGMFYAFYDMNRSIERINSLFDGLGIAVGTTVAGLVVSIFAMIFYTTLKYRLVRSLSLVESEALSLSTLIVEQ